MKEIISGLLYWLINHVVTHIPCWPLRKKCYELAGLTMGGSRVLIGTQFEGIPHIIIGKHSYINRNCHLDGRGGLYIGNNVNISSYTAIITGSHDMTSDSFAYRPGEVRIEDYCWLGTRSMVLDKSHLAKGVVLSAGSVLKGETLLDSVYAGIPAVRVKARNLSGQYDVGWRPWFS